MGQRPRLRCRTVRASDWQPTQWQAMASKGGFVPGGVLPQRQPPSRGSFQSFIARLHALPG